MRGWLGLPHAPPAQGAAVWRLIWGEEGGVKPVEGDWSVALGMSWDPH